MNKKDNIIKQKDRKINKKDNIIKQKNKKIQCDRCGKNFTTLANRRRHFNIKKTCKPLLKNILIEDLREKYKVQQGIYKCENCGKEYKSAVGKCKHKKKCLLNPIIIEKKTIDKLETELEEKDIKLEEKDTKLEELEEQVKQLLLEKSENVKTINNTTNNTKIENLIINIYNNGNEKEMTEKDIEYYVTKAMQICDERFPGRKYYEAIPYIIKQIHFNPKYPENQNLKLTNINSPIMDIYKDNKWKKVPTSKQLPDIIESAKEFIEDNKKGIDYSSHNWEDLCQKIEENGFDKEKNKKLDKNIETSLKCELYNGTKDIEVN
tara:strand:+ start:217 stop:1179 length:963 start_codon:yes stop_codon:yes gene_type:complete